MFNVSYLITLYKLNFVCLHRYLNNFPHCMKRHKQSLLEKNKTSVTELGEEEKIKKYIKHFFLKLSLNNSN